MSWVDLLFLQTVQGYAGWLFVFAVLTLIEVAFARERQSLLCRVKGLLFWAAWVPAAAASTMAVGALYDQIGVQPLLSLPLFQGLSWAGPVGAVAAAVLGAIVGDFFGYWFHRLQHGPLWRFHAVHHSIRELNAVNSYHHITEVALHLLVMTIPVSLVVVDQGPAIPAMVALLWMQVVFLHSPTRLHFGPLRALFADNRFHRIHHSVEPRHFDKNFGAITTLWDRLFGTAHFPAADEWPEVGLAEIDQPQTWRAWFDLPFRYRAGAQSSAASSRSSVGQSEPVLPRGTASSA